MFSHSLVVSSRDFAGEHLHRATLDGAVQKRWIRGMGNGVCLYIFFLGFHRSTCVKGI